MINSDNSIILVIDLQEKLVNMLLSDEISQKASLLVKAGNILDIPVIFTEQYPKGLGATLEKLKQTAPENAVFFEKTSFSAVSENGFKEMLAGHNKEKVILCGVETHVCVYQTAAELIKEGYDAHVLSDITASRREVEFKAGIEKMKQIGIKVSSLEITLFELLRTSKHPKFKEIQALIK